MDESIASVSIELEAAYQLFPSSVPLVRRDQTFRKILFLYSSRTGTKQIATYTTAYVSAAMYGFGINIANGWNSIFCSVWSDPGALTLERNDARNSDNAYAASAFVPKAIIGTASRVHFLFTSSHQRKMFSARRLTPALKMTKELVQSRLLRGSQWLHAKPASRQSAPVRSRRLAFPEALPDICRTKAVRTPTSVEASAEMDERKPSGS